MKILVTGGSGLLGKEILALDSTLIAPTSSELDITDSASIEAALNTHKPDTVLHLAAATKPPEHEEHPERGITTNVIGTALLAAACAERGIRLVYTSSDYVYAGPGPHKESEPTKAPSKFIWSKLGGEAAVAVIPGSLILRLSFGPVPFPWEKVYEDQWNSKLYVDEMAPLVLALAQGSETGIMNVGGPKTSLADYARRTRPDIVTIPRPAWVPEDTSLDLTRMKAALAIEDEQTLLKHQA